MFCRTKTPPRQKASHARIRRDGMSVKEHDTDGETTAGSASLWWKIIAGSSVGVGGSELSKAAVLQDDFRQGAAAREPVETAFVGGNAAFSSFFQAFGGDAHFVEQDFLQLFGRIEAERLVCQRHRLVVRASSARRRVPRFWRASSARSICTPLRSISNNTCATGSSIFSATFRSCLKIHSAARRCSFEAQGEIRHLGRRIPVAYHRWRHRQNRLLRAAPPQRSTSNSFQAKPAFGQFIQGRVRHGSR